MSFRREIGSFLYENKSESVNSSVVSDSFETPWTIYTCQAPLSMGFSRQEYQELVAIPFSRGSS